MNAMKSIARAKCPLALAFHRKGCIADVRVCRRARKPASLPPEARQNASLERTQGSRRKSSTFKRSHLLVEELVERHGHEALFGRTRQHVRQRPDRRRLVVVALGGVVQ